jgi:hypothetical protein
VAAVDKFVTDRDSDEGGPGVSCRSDKGLEIVLEVLEVENPSEYFHVVGFGSV